MGEAKNLRRALSSTPCPCGSGRFAPKCCFTRGYWRKPPAKLGLTSLPAGITQNNCYLASLGTCDGGLSGEHLISESVMRFLAGDGEFTIGGTPWLPEGELKSVGFNSLTAKCLCRKHNSALHPLDDAAVFFFGALREAFESESAQPKALMSGHDLERWLLKTLTAMAVSGNLGRGRERLTGDFTDGVDVATLLDDVAAWPPGSGLYCVMAPGQMTQNHNRFQLAPITADNGTISGLWANILGVSFVLLLEPLDLTRSPQLKGAVHRPSAIIVDHPAATNQVLLSWVDGLLHQQALSLRFVSKVGES